MAQLPVYRQQGNITTKAPGQIRDLDTFSQGYQMMQKNANALVALSAQWQESKDAVENLDGKNKLNSGISAILDEASNFNEYSTPEELSKKQEELTQRMNNLVPEIVSGFSNNQRAREFELNGQYATQQNVYKLQEIFRSKYGDMYNANLQETADSSLRNFTKTGNEAFKQEYFSAIDTGVNAGYLNREQAEKLKLGTNEWNYDYVYSQILDDPYFKASDEVMEKIDPVHQRTLRNFQRTEIKRAQQEAMLNADADFYANPTRDNLRRVYRVNRGAKNNKNYETIATTVPNYNTVSNINGYADAVAAIKDLASSDNSNYNNKQLFLAKAGDVALRIVKSNVDASGNATLSEKEKNRAMQMLYKTMKDKTFQDQMKTLPNLNYLRPEEITGQMSYGKAILPVLAVKDAAKNAVKIYKETNPATATYRNTRDAVAWKKIDDIGKRTCENVINHFAQGDVQGGLKAYDDGLKSAIKAKYWYIPELQNPNLKVGTTFTVHGKVYRFQGFTQKDIIVEVN